MKRKGIKTQFSQKRTGYQRALEVSEDKIEVALKLIKRSLKSWLEADSVLADSWFICEKFIMEIRRFVKSLHVIGLMKTNRIVTIDGKSYKINTVPELKRKNEHYSKKFKHHYITSPIIYKGIKMRGYWIRMNGQNS